MSASKEESIFSSILYRRYFWKLQQLDYGHRKQDVDQSIAPKLSPFMFYGSSVPYCKPKFLPLSLSMCTAGWREQRTRRRRMWFLKCSTNCSHFLSCGAFESSSLPWTQGTLVLAPSLLLLTVLFADFPFQLLNILMPLFLKESVARHWD